jgi:hypothetical protein
MDWVWSALHLDDGTHVHGLDLRIPGMPPLAAGYVQSAGSGLVELETVAARETFDEHDLPLSTEIDCGPDDLAVTVDVLGHAPVLLTAADGRVSRFPRAWGTVRTGDGRTGVGWIEWNRNRS